MISIVTSTEIYFIQWNDKIITLILLFLHNFEMHILKDCQLPLALERA